MTDFGIETYDRFGRVTLSSKYSQLRIVNIENKGAWSLADSYFPSGFAEKVTALPDELVFIKLPVQSAWFWQISKRSAYPTYFNDNEYAAISQAEGIKLDYIVAKTYAGVLPATTGYGFECYDSTGNVLMSSRWAHLNILAGITIPPSALHANHEGLSIYEISLPDEYKYADIWVCINNLSPICFYTDGDFLMARCLAVKSVIESGVRKVIFSEQTHIANNNPGYGVHSIYPYNRFVFIGVY